MSSINYEPIDAQVVGIIILIPVVGMQEQPVIETYKQCQKCEVRPHNDWDEFCSKCGGPVVSVTGKVKLLGGHKNQYVTEDIPLPDVRAEMKELGIERFHLPFDEDGEVGYADFVWKFVYKEYETIGHRSHFVPFITELNIKQISDDLEEAKEKFKKILKKYKGKVVFGIAGEHADW